MTKLTLLISAVAAAATIAAAAADARAASAACTAGNTTYQGVRARVYCGSASAVVKVGSRTLTYRGGSCTRTATAVELGIGTLILDSKQPKTLPRAFAISVGRIFGIGKPAAKDGSYRSVIVAYVDAGKRYAAMQGSAVLAGGRTRGSFTAKLFTGETISGTFRCS
jgi:hypothetical protein